MANRVLFRVGKWLITVSILAVLAFDASLFAMPEYLRWPVIEWIEELRFGWPSLRRPPEPWNPFTIGWSVVLLLTEIKAVALGWSHSSSGARLPRMLAQVGLLVLIALSVDVGFSYGPHVMLTGSTLLAYALPAILRVAAAWLAGDLLDELMAAGSANEA